MIKTHEELAVPDALRRWSALDSLWQIGAREEAQRLADSFVGRQASLQSEVGEAAPVTLTAAEIARDHAAPGGIAINFGWERNGAQGGPTSFQELLYVPEEEQG